MYTWLNHNSSVVGRTWNTWPNRSGKAVGRAYELRDKRDWAFLCVVNSVHIVPLLSNRAVSACQWGWHWTLGPRSQPIHDNYYYYVGNDATTSLSDTPLPYIASCFSTCLCLIKSRNNVSNLTWGFVYRLRYLYDV